MLVMTGRSLDPSIAWGRAGILAPHDMLVATFSFCQTLLYILNHFFKALKCGVKVRSFLLELIHLLVMLLRPELHLR